jgi:hypothetical protein
MSVQITKATRFQIIKPLDTDLSRRGSPWL